MTLPTFAAQRWRLQNDICSTPMAIHRYILPTGCSAANPPAAVATADRWERRTPDHYIDPASHTMSVSSVNNLMIQKTLDVSMTSQRLDAVRPTYCFRLPPPRWWRRMYAIVHTPTGHGENGCICGAAFDVWSQRADVSGYSSQRR